MPEPKDYSKTAVKLCNPAEVKALLDKLHQHKTILAKLEAHVPTRLANEMMRQQRILKAIDTEIREAVETHGSYQDIETGDYAVKYKTTSKSYEVAPLKEHFPNFASLCITETVNVPALEGQVKGKLLTEEELEEKGVLVKSYGHGFYIR